MITNFERHWDGVGGKSYYTLSMMRDGLRPEKLVENTPTIFVKRKKVTREIEGCWQGRVHAFSPSSDSKGRNIVRFQFDLEKAIECPPEYGKYSEGWYQVEGSVGTPSAPFDSEMDPPFLSVLSSTSDWGEFEKYSSWLLKLLGIHNLHTFSRQRGKADGFFKLGGLVVVYDCTLESNFEKVKKDQIYNYSRQLKGENLEYEDGDVDIRNCQKQIWIITKGSTRIIRKIDEATVKEIGIRDLIHAFRKRMRENLQEDGIVNYLANLR